ncbi:hypothetical protein ONZ45_g14220 [Pleurotus djamor]|nr:hypothetical protein ONZ45_g14220 [Pleurotus djamor]
MSHCEDCFKGVKHDGTPEGEWTKIGGIDAYASTPKDADYPKDKVILFLTDIFGPQLINNQLLSDAFARNGFKTVVPDLFEGDPVPIEVMSGQPWNREEWASKHSPEQARPVVDKVVNALKEQNITTIGTTGYCYGARLAFDLAFEGMLNVVVVAHPSRLVIPDDLEKYAQTVKAPLLINSCTTDPQFPLEAQARADEILGEGKFAPGYLRMHWEGCRHGFAVRGDLQDPAAKTGLEGAFKASADCEYSLLVFGDILKLDWLRNFQKSCFGTASLLLVKHIHFRTKMDVTVEDILGAGSTSITMPNTNTTPIVNPLPTMNEITTTPKEAAAILLQNQ